MAFSVLAASGRRSALYLGVLVFLIVVALAILWPRAQPAEATDVSAPSGSGAMSLSLAPGHTGTCATEEQCTLPTGSSFTLIVSVDEITYVPERPEDGVPNLQGSDPCGDGIDNGDGDGADAGDIDCIGYHGLQSWLDYADYIPGNTEDPDAVDNVNTPFVIEGPGPCDDGIDNGADLAADESDLDCVGPLSYKETAAATDEILWPDCEPFVALRGNPAIISAFQGTFTFPGAVFHGCLTGLVSLPESKFVGNWLQLAFNCSASPSVTTIELVPFRFDPPSVENAFLSGFAVDVTTGDLHASTVPASDTLTINCVEPPTPTATPTATPFPALQKSPSLQNLFLTRQGAKIPPVQCVGPQGGDDVAVFTHKLSQPITSLDPKGSGQPQQLGAFEFEVHYDQSKVCVELQPGLAAANMTCFVQDDVTKPVLEGVARIGCVTIGKTGFPDTTTPEGRRLADVLVRPQPDVYSQAIPNQGNGVVVQFLNQQCELADLQGHPIALFSCDDADVTIRYLEGDVEPDCVVNTLDTQAIAFRWGASKGDLLFLDRFNLEPFGAQSDDDVDIKDLQVVYGRIGSTCAAPHPPQGPANPKGGPTFTPTPAFTSTPTPTPTLTPSGEAVKPLAGCNASQLPANDDGSTGPVTLSFSPKFFGTTYSSLFVNNNGNVTFDAPLAIFTPFDLNSTSRVIIAPFFGDVDTRGTGSGIATYGNTTFGGRTTFCANWVNVGYFGTRTDKLNSFQLLLVDRSDVGVGDFDIIFNFDQIQWETGEASGGTDGLGGFSARAGYSNGVDTSFELPGSAVNGAFLDSNTTTGLIQNSLNSTQNGRYVIPIRGGIPQP